MKRQFLSDIITSKYGKYNTIAIDDKINEINNFIFFKTNEGK